VSERTVSVDTTVLGGFPVTVSGVIYDPSPSVGIFTREVEVRRLTNRRGKAIPFIEKKLKPRDFEFLRMEIMENDH
jgi:hypothetical protein